MPRQSPPPTLLLRRHARFSPTKPEEPELTILMPCLDEAETIGACVRKAVAWLRATGTPGEVLVADNGSVDGSQELARLAGARVIDVEVRGYGAALLGGLRGARGTYVIMGDADDTYDFSRLDDFLVRLRAGDQAVIGNRFAGRIAPKAMPWTHRYIGNPVLSALGRRFFGIGIGDFHCGLRGVDRRAILELSLQTTGMEFASELIVRAAQAGYRVTEVPTSLGVGGRTRPPHLRTWSDGWRHLRFLLLFSPRWLFRIPGMLALMVGCALVGVLTFADIPLGGVVFSVGTLIYAAALATVGLQALMFSLFATIYAVQSGLSPPPAGADVELRSFRLERGIVVGCLLVVAGLVLGGASVWRWSAAGFGSLDPVQQVRIIVPAVLGLTMGTSVILGSFFLSILQLGMDRRHR
ncbi:glycosyltransferase family 2 protein [soil metagenome]